MRTNAFFRWTQLERATYPAWRDGIIAAESGDAARPSSPRAYPGYPCFALPRLGRRWWPALDRVLARRRCTYPLGTALPSPRTLGRVLGLSHGITGASWAGPAPSAGGLQALELHLAVLTPGWLSAGLYHYDRAGHHLSQLASGVDRVHLQPIIPSLERLEGGALLWLLIGDGARAAAKYGERGVRFLLLEAGHVMQNLCLASTSVGLTTVPLGGFFERDLAKRLQLLETDEVLYVGACG
jgi:SagB-type dehydrogenase family enzyme